MPVAPWELRRIRDAKAWQPDAHAKKKIDEDRKGRKGRKDCKGRKEARKDRKDCEDRKEDCKGRKDCQGRKGRKDCNDTRGAWTEPAPGLSLRLVRSCTNACWHCWHSSGDSSCLDGTSSSDIV